MASDKPPVKKWTHTLYFGTGSLIKSKDRMKEKSGQIRIRFPSVEDAFNIINELKLADVDDSSSGGMPTGIQKLYIPTRMDGVITFRPSTCEMSEDKWPIRYKNVPDFAFSDEDWCVVIVVFDSLENEELFWKYISSNPKSGISYIPDPKIKSFWLPEKSPQPKTYHRWVSSLPAKEQLPQYPIYVLSKGRWKKRLTADALNTMGVPFYLLIEDCEKEQYSATESYKTNYLIMPPEMNNLGEGSITARNFAWEHSIQNGHKKHWVMDDNMNGFYRFYKNERIKCNTGIAIKQAEVLTSQYDNVYLSGLQYLSFCPTIARNKSNAIINTRIYSCILIKNDLDIKLNTVRWRGKYNEDTDLSLRVLKSGGANLLLQNFLCDKQTTMSCKGGNTAEIYNPEINGLKLKYDSLYNQHPDCVKPSTKFKKELHHQVDYSKWANNPLRLNGVPIETGAQLKGDIDEMGLHQIVLDIPKGKEPKVKIPKKKVIGTAGEVPVKEAIEDVQDHIAAVCPPPALAPAPRKDSSTQTDQPPLKSLRLKLHEPNGVGHHMDPISQHNMDCLIKMNHQNAHIIREQLEKIKTLEKLMGLYFNS